MEIRKYTEYPLDPKDENLVATVLKMGGWHEGRSVDITKVEDHYKKYDWELNTPARAFFKEFYNITKMFCFKTKKQEWSVGGNELHFDTTLTNEVLEVEEEEDISEFETEKALVAKRENTGFVPIAFSGFHLGGNFWVGNSGTFYRTYYFSSDAIEEYSSVMELFEHDLAQFRSASQLFVSIGGYAKEWGVGGDFYMKKYLKEYGEP